jgi:hypothetical protein
LKNRLLGLLALGLLVAPIEATASPITYAFAVNGGPSGPLAGVTSSGHFTFDDSIIPAGGGTLDHANLFTDLAFTWNGISYDENTANTGRLAFDAGGALVPMFFFGSNCAAGVCAGHQGVNEWFFQVADEGIFFEYGIPGVAGIQTGSGSVSLQTSAVPEPGTLVLIGLGLGGIGFTRRKRAEMTKTTAGGKRDV